MPCVPQIHPLSIVSKLSMPAAVEKKWKPQNGHKPYAPCAPCAPKNNDTPRTSAINKPRPVQDQLTLHDWLSVMQYFDTNQPISQEEVVKHFVSRADCWEKEWSCVSIWRSPVSSILRLVACQHCFCNNNCGD